MSTPRLATIPFEHVEAEIAAFPLASVESFQLGTISLNPLVSRGGNDKLWRHAERVVLNALPSVPLDEAVGIRDKLWFDSSNLNDNSPTIDQRIAHPVSLLTYLRRLAAGYLNQAGRPLEKSTLSRKSCSSENLSNNSHQPHSWHSHTITFECRSRPPVT
jgi:hypothetical protein